MMRRSLRTRKRLMQQDQTSRRGIVLGDPVPWFGAPLIGQGEFNLSVAAGRWIVLAFLGARDYPRLAQELSGLLRENALFDEDRMVLYGVLTAPPPDAAPFIAL